MFKLNKKAGVAKRVRRQHTGAFKARVRSNAIPRKKRGVEWLKWHTVGSTDCASFWCGTRSLNAVFFH